MAVLLRPTIMDSCQSTVRVRRRSSVFSIGSAPLFSGGTSVTLDGSAISDEPANVSELGPKLSIPCLSPLSDAHMSDYAIKFTVPRHHDAPPTFEMCSTSSPPSTPGAATSDNRISSVLGDSDKSTCKSHTMGWRLASGYFAYFMCGWGDGVTGTVLPYFMEEFHLTFMTSSLLFAASTCGFVIGTVLVESIFRTFGRVLLTHSPRTSFSSFPSLNLGFFSRNSQHDVGVSALKARHISLLVSSILHGMFFVLMGTRQGFPVLFLAYMLAAFARSILTASLNQYFASSRKSALGYAFGLWSFGGVASPLVCQTVVSAGIPWFKFYYGSLILSSINTTCLVLSFKPTSQEFMQEYRAFIGGIRKDIVSGESTPTSEVGCASGSAMGVKALPPRNTLRLALCMPYQWAFSVFALFYCGCETTTQGFMVTYLLNTRHANPKSVGYVTSGFWGGITVGRFAWGYFAPLLNFTQRKYIIQGCIVMILVMQLLVWFINSYAANALSTSVIGLVCGPIFPACLAMANDILPAEVRMISMGLISSCASFGAALFPFVTGAISNAKGVQTLTYVTVALAAVLTCLWAMFPERLPHTLGKLV